VLGFFACVGLLSCEDSPPATVGAYSVSLPDLVGPIPFDTGSGQRVAFEFDQAFSSIDRVSLEIEASVSSTQFDVCGFVYDPQPCVREVHLLGFLAILDHEGSAIPGVVLSEALDIGEDRFALTASGTGTGAFGGGEATGWDFLLDGEGTFDLFWNAVLGNPDRRIENPVEPAGEILDARLTIEGTPAS
jgi:hypothetical protein